MLFSNLVWYNLGSSESDQELQEQKNKYAVLNRKYRANNTLLENKINKIRKLEESKENLYNQHSDFLKQYGIEHEASTLLIRDQIRKIFSAEEKIRNKNEEINRSLQDQQLSKYRINELKNKLEENQQKNKKLENDKLEFGKILNELGNRNFVLAVKQQKKKRTRYVQYPHLKSQGVSRIIYSYDKSEDYEEHQFTRKRAPSLSLSSIQVYLSGLGINQPVKYKSPDEKYKYKIWRV